MTGDPGLDHARPKALVGGAGNEDSGERHPPVSVHPKSRLADILAYSRTREPGVLWKLPVCRRNGAPGAGAQARGRAGAQ